MEDLRWNPGGWVAKKSGCTCPRLDNQEGGGRKPNDAFVIDNSAFYLDVHEGKYFIISYLCPLHADLARNRPTSGQDNG